jgi:hypothetical protein
MLIHLANLGQTNSFKSGYGTGLEGPWDEVMNAIKACHEAGQHHLIGLHKHRSDPLALLLKLILRLVTC